MPSSYSLGACNLAAEGKRGVKASWHCSARKVAKFKASKALADAVA
jgi:hypothetical protein